MDSVITVYTYTTLPIYYYLQKPWIRLSQSDEEKAIHEDPLDPYSPWRRITTDPKLEAFEVESVDSLLETAAKTNGKNYVISGVKVSEGGKYFYDWFTYGDVIKRVDNIAKGLQLVGVSAGDKVLIFAETRLEWMLCAFAVFKLGGVVTTLFAQLGIDGIIHGINQTQVKYAITTKQQLIKLRSVLTQTPSVQKIIDMDGMNIGDGTVDIMSLKRVETTGKKSDIVLPEVSLNKRDDLALIMYTSGTTGTPKGAIVTHGQLIAQAKSTICIFKTELSRIQRHCYIAYLPLGHMFEFTAELIFFGSGIRMGYASALTLFEGAPGLVPGETPDLQLLKPTIFLAVPLVLDRIRRTVTEQMEGKPLAKGMFKTLLDYKTKWRAKGYTTFLTNHFLCRKAKQKLGSNVEIMLVGGAPVSYETERLMSLIFDLTLIQGYGGTEVCGASHARGMLDLTLGHTGPPMSGFRVRLVDWTDGGYSVRDKPNPRGEIVINGDSVVSGYYMMDKETNEAFCYENGEKWYYTGDIGEVDGNGYFKIIDRRKDLLKLQNGEYYSLGKIESAVKSCPLIENICVYGISTHDYLIALVIPNTNALQGVSKKLSLSAFSFDQLCDNNRVERSVLDSIREYGLDNGLSKRELPTKLKLCADEWTTDNGLLTAALKLKRTAIIQKYKSDINLMFDDINNNNDNNNNNISKH
ncbi:long-chain-fatty-acid--CoA ligase 4-like [Oppia nitens]|uniref:long-chain-fatty-acid--CoA ligase 4-like n=1 Tax=Oppia nitens TaxID=1686743 RepID=UPI0023DBECE3|nr:long-chain-fatty-acid--CoA ligase 4-like [Oppia nitens]